MKVALVGIGKIAVDQHVPALAASPDWTLAATVSRSGTVDGVEAFTDIATMLAARPDIGMVSLALPPVPRFAYAEAALRAGRHVMLEKPPGATLAEIHALQALADRQGVTLYATWHSRIAHAVAPAKAWLADKTITRAHITWREDVRKWHPGQDWVFEPGGMGVFDPGINALSILTEILPAPVHLRSAELEFPENRQTPIAARLAFSGHVTADFDWRQTGPQTWDIEVETTEGPMALRMGGNLLEIGGQPSLGANTIMDEYPALYARMAELVAAGRSEVDLSPMIHVADAMTLGKRITTDAFHF
ncbi:MAG: Gfo/Idh/MocA family oxidoreductase [Cypionkella sp.]|nr:Gfo/Idh/MocA family oxidoreductase [Cypionkella sp.]